MTALRSQMNPHFIFNCLNSIKLYSVQNDSVAASEYLTKFSKLIRLVLENSRKEKVELQSELESLRLYIEMEAMRFKEKLQYTIPKRLILDYMEIPPLLIQPYVENAIWHGLMHRETGGNIDIMVTDGDTADLLKIVITDNGVGRAKAAELKSKSAVIRKSFGMKVTSERIALINQLFNTNTTVVITDLYQQNGEAGDTSHTTNSGIMPLKVIIIDDEPDSVNLLQLQLTEHCPQVKVVGSYTSTVKALDGIETLQPDLLFLDIEMPVMNGFEMLEKVLHIIFSLVFRHCL